MSIELEREKSLGLGSNNSGQEACIARFIEVFFRKLKKEVCFSVLRWSNSAWESGRDIDIFLAADSTSVAISLLKELAKTEFVPIVYEVHKGGDCHVLLTFIHSEGEVVQPFLVDFHFQSTIIEKGRSFLEFKTIESFISPTEEGLPALLPPLEAALLVLHEVVGKKSFKEEYWLFIREVHEKSRDQFLEMLMLICEPQLSQKIAALIDIEDKGGCLQLGKEFLLGADKKKALKSNSLYERMKRRFFWLLFPPGNLVVFEGERTVMSKGFQEILGLLPYKTLYLPSTRGVSYLHLFFVYIFQLRPILAKNGVVAIERDMQKEKGPLASLLQRCFDCLSDITVVVLPTQSSPAVREDRSSQTILLQKNMPVAEALSSIFNAIKPGFKR